MNDASTRLLGRLVDEVGRCGWCVVPDFVERGVAEGLWAESMGAWAEGEFRRAGVGRGEELQVREEVRRDHVMWLSEEGLTLGQRGYLARLEEVRVALNRGLYLGLRDFEGHFAVYPEGGFYKPHLDRHRGCVERVVTVILYLNGDWQPGDGGELKVWVEPGDREGVFELVEPRMGTLVCFLAGDHWHEVLPARRTRASITGWFRGDGG